MATNWPTSRDTFTNPTSGDTLDSPSHAAQHANINDAVAALQLHAGLVLVKTQTIGTAVSSVTVTNAFSATFDNYKITVNGGTGSNNAIIGFQLGNSTTGYYNSRALASYASATYLGGNTSNGSSWSGVGVTSTVGLSLVMELFGPNLAARTFFTHAYAATITTEYAGSGGGFHNVATAYTDFTLLPNVGTMTGGTIRVYGYNNG